MSMLRINATSDGLALHGSPQSVSSRICTVARHTGPVIIMVHGYKYAPGSEKHCPHKKIMGERPRDWPASLGFGQSNPEEGTAVAFGWFARGNLGMVHQRAQNLGKNLAALITALKTKNPTRPVHVIAHSMGTEAALSALQHLPHGAIDRMALLTGASYTGYAQEMLKTPAGRSAEILNVISRENDLFDLAFERLIRPHHANDRAIGQGISARNVINIQLDCPETLGGFRHLGFDIATPYRRVCHWSSYTRSGTMEFYSAFFRSPETTSLQHLKHSLPARTAPRWSRLFTVPRVVRQWREFALPFRAQPIGSPRRTIDAVIAGTSKNDPAY